MSGGTQPLTLSPTPLARSTPLPVLHQRRTPCLGRLDAARDWAPTMAVQVGDRVLGIRSTGGPGSAGIVEEAVAALRRPATDSSVAPNFSVELAATGPSRARRGLNLVYRDHEIVARRRDLKGLLDDLLEILDATRHPFAVDLLAVEAAAVVADGVASLLPAGWHRRLLLHRERLAAGGVTLLAPGTHLVDPEAAVLIRDNHLLGRASPPLPVARWAVRVPAAAPHPTRAAAVQAAFPAVANIDVLGPGAVLRALAALSAVVRFQPVGPLDESAPGDLTRWLAHADGAAGG